MKKQFRICLLSLLALPIVVLSSCSSDAPAETTPPVEVNENVTLDLVKDGKTDYTIVYDDKNEAATALANTIRSFFTARDTEIAAVAASTAEADYGHEIVVGNVRAASADVAAKMKSADFAMCASADDWILLATDATHYDYLTMVMKDRIFSRLLDGTLSVGSEQDMIYSTSAYADASYAAYVKKESRALSQEFLEEIMVANSFSATDRTRLPYRLYVPSNYDPEKEYPVLIFLHGAGERGGDNTAQLLHVVRNLFNQKDSPVLDAIVICPQCPNNNQWVDTPWDQGSYSLANVPQSNESKAVVELLDQIASTYSTDTDRYYVMGISMGGFGTWDLIMRYPEKFAAAVPICGGADPSMAQTLKDFPIYTAHGSSDSIVPVSGTREMVAALQAAGSTVLTYEEKAGMDHDVWTQFSQQTEVLQWLFSQKLSDRK